MIKQAAPPRLYYGWVIVGAIFLAMFFAAGTRFSFGAFYDALLGEFGWSRSSLAAAASLNLILAGLSRPLVGVMVDRYGSKAVMVGGLALAAVALVLLSSASQLWHFYVLFSLMSLGYGAASPATTVPLISNWFVRRRATAQSFAQSGSPMGELVIVPIITAVLLLTDWRTAYRVLAVFIAFLLIPSVAAIVRNRPEEMGLAADGLPMSSAEGGSGPTHGLGAGGPVEANLTLKEAMGAPFFWQLTFGFFVCGFTMSFAQTHFMAFAGDMGIARMTASVAMGMIGGVSIFGTLGLGYLADRYSRKNLLAITYLLRGLAFLALWRTSGVDFLFVGAFLLGLSWGATIPLTSACVADACGRQYLGSIFGMMFAVMPLGSGLGAWLAGWVYDVAGSYAPALLLDGLLGLAAAATVFFVRITQPSPAAEPVLGGLKGNEGR